MIILGLTGSIAMGKSTVAEQFAACGAKRCSADALVHRLLAKGGAGVEAVADYFPETLHALGHIDRKALGNAVFKNEEALNRLERTLHPLVAQAREQFLAAMQSLGAPWVVLEIPLLFETGAEESCDVVATVTAPAWLQRQRARARGMSEARLASILSRQMPDQEKRQLADYVIHTGLGRAYSFQQVKAIMKELS